MRILIVGGGEIGHALARALSADHALSVVDHAPATRDRFASLDVDFLVGPGTSAEALRRAGAADADLLVACTGLDEVNLVACAIASRLGVRRTICFVSREDFVGDGSLREHFGIERVVWPEAQLAEEIERIIAAPGAIDAEIFAGGRIRLLEYRLQPGAGAARPGRSRRCQVPRGALIVAVGRSGTIEIPHGETQLEAGDKIIVMGTPGGARGAPAGDRARRAAAQAPDRDHHRRRGRRLPPRAAARSGRRRGPPDRSSATARAASSSRRPCGRRSSSTATAPTSSCSSRSRSAAATCWSRSSTTTSATSSRRCSAGSSACARRSPA
jgi:Trk K+ transport system NAD-binding subunit